MRKLKFDYNNKEELSFFNKFKDNELLSKDHKELIGKKAKFKDDLRGYCRVCWNKKGVIVDSERTPYLYLKFDEPIKSGLGNSCITRELVINKNSIEVKD
jgi:hypothetical protein